MSAVVGSHLYGLAHADSDTDEYTVVDSVQTRKRNGVVCAINEDIDSKIIDLSTFLRFAAAGQPQALEMMFHPHPSIEGPLMRFYRASYRANVLNMEDHYREVINRLDQDVLKHRRHGIRLALNLRQARTLNGRFNPSMNDDDRARILVWSEDKSTYCHMMRSLLG